MQLNREAFLRNLEAVQPGLSPTNILEQSNSFIFKNGKVITYNDEAYCRCASGLDAEFTGALPGKPLLACLQKLQEDNLEVERTKTHLILKGKGKRRVELLMQTEILLPLNTIEKPRKWQPLHEDFAEAINTVKDCTSSRENEDKFYKVAIHIHPKWIEATDKFQICRWRVKTPVLKPPILVRASTIKPIVSLGMTEFSETDSWLFFRNPGGLVYACRRYLDDYPELTRFLEVKGEPITLPKGLAEALEGVKIFSEENADNKNVKVDLRGKRLVLIGEGVHGRWIEPRKVVYAGQDLIFTVPPQILADLVTKHRDCEVSERALKANGGKYTYVTSLHLPGDEEVSVSQESEEGAE